MTDTKTKTDLEEENEELRAQLANAMTKCPNCGFNPAEHKGLVEKSTPA